MELQARLDRGQQWLTQLLELMACPAGVRAELRPDPHAAIGQQGWLTIEDQALFPDRIQTLIGQGGEVIDAMQFLANLELNLGREPEENLSYTLELAGYRQQRLAELTALAERVADAVRSSGQEQRIEHLSSAERRQLHQLFDRYPDLEAVGEGREPHRYLRVSVRPVTPD